MSSTIRKLPEEHVKNTHLHPSGFLSSFQNKAEQLRDRVKVTEWEKEFMEENLTAYRNEMNLRFYQAQGQVASGRQATRKQLTQLAVQGDAAAEKQQAAIAQVKHGSPVCTPAAKVAMLPTHP